MQEQRKNKQFVILIILYFVFTIAIHYSNGFEIGKNLVGAISDTQAPPPNIKNLLSIFKNQNYEGTWYSSPGSQNQDLTKSKGKFMMQFTKIGPNDKQKYDLLLYLNNGEYIDDGNLVLHFRIIPPQWQSVRNGTAVHLVRKEQSKANASASEQKEIFRVSYQHNIILQTMQSLKLDANDLRIVYEYDKIKDSLKIGIRIESQQISATMVVARQQKKMLPTIIFALVLFTISYMQFSAIMSILKSILEGEDQPINYSIITAIIAMMWDAALCLVSFIEAFRNQENLILFIMPAFLLCLLFTNLELRLILMIFQANSGQSNIRSFLCKFNLLSYGSLLLIYPIMYIFNFSTLFFLLISLIFLPQIYNNGVNSHRPNLAAPYYKKFLTTRFISILYLKCFPWNIFELQPDYILGFGCLSLLCLQLFWLWLQKMYGPRRVLPRFLMPDSYDYNCKLTKDEQLEQCAICISPLGNNSDIPIFRFRQPYKVMKAPCGHKYHGSCLSEWMQIKKQCPQCRKKLPAYE